MENRLVPVALSATHVGFSALRLEPTWTALGQAAGLAAHLAIAGKLPLRKVAPARIQELLHEAGASTIYFSDVLPGHPQYRLAQFFGTRGFFHGLAPLEQIRLEPLRKRFGLQYSHAIPHHEARLDAPPGPDTIQRWQKLSIEEEVCTVPPVSAPTRGAYLEELYRCARVGR